MSSGPPIKKLRQQTLSFKQTSNTSILLDLKDKFPLYEVENVPADGNCQFTALAIQLGRTATATSDVRQEIVDYLRSNPNIHAGIDIVNILAEDGGSFENYLKKMSLGGTWGDGLTLAAAASLYSRSITVITDNDKRFTIDAPSTVPELQNFGTNAILLGYVGSRDSIMKNHYVSLKQRDDNTGGVALQGGNIVIEKACHSPTLSAYQEESLKIAMDSHLNRVSDSTSDDKRRKRSTKDDRWLDSIIQKRKVKFPWLKKSDDGAVCNTCCQFYAIRGITAKHSGIFINVPFTDWAKSTGSEPKCNKLLKHQQSSTHLDAATFSCEEASMLIHKSTVYSMVHKQSAEQRQDNLNRFADFIDCAYFLFKHEIPHTTKFNHILELVARLDGSSQLQRFLDLSPQNATYISSTTATEILTAVSQWLTEDLLHELQQSDYIAILADESTDIRTRNELSVCFRYVIHGVAVERFFCLRQLLSTTGDVIADALKDVLCKNNIPLGRVFWMAFDGAANMSGRVHGVQAILKRDLLTNANYIHCRSHLLNLAAANVANDFKPLKCLFSSFNSLWKFFHNSPKRHNQLVEMRNVLNDTTLELVRAGDTRWTSNYRSVKAVRLSLKSLIFTLQNIHMSGDDLASEAGGLLLTFQNQCSILLTFAVEQILQPLNILTLQLQSPKLSLVSLPEKIEASVARLSEISSDCASYSEGFKLFLEVEHVPTVGEAVDIDHVHKTIVQPYISKICRNIEKRFGDSAGQVSTAASVFTAADVETKPLSQQLQHIRLLSKYFKLNDDDISAEWICFRKFLEKHKSEACDEICKRLLNSDVGDSFPQLKTLAGILLSCPIGTANVERSFSTMSRLCNKIRQRLTSDHLAQLLLIAQEGPDKLNREELNKIAYTWHQQNLRRIQFPTL